MGLPSFLLLLSSFISIQRTQSERSGGFPSVPSFKCTHTSFPRDETYGPGITYSLECRTYESAFPPVVEGSMEPTTDAPTRSLPISPISSDLPSRSLLCLYLLPVKLILKKLSSKQSQNHCSCMKGKHA